MKNIFVKILAIMVIGLFLLWYFTNQSRMSNKTDKLDYKHKLDSINISLGLANAEISSLKTALTESDTTYTYKLDSISFYYEAELDAKDKLIADKAIVAPPAIITEDTTTHIKTLKQTFTRNKVSVFLEAKYVGVFKGFDLKWKFPAIQVENKPIVYVPTPYEVIKNVPINKRMVYLTAEVLFIDKSYTFIGIDYFDLKRFKWGASVDPLNKMYMAKVGYRLFRF